MQVVHRLGVFIRQEIVRSPLVIEAVIATKCRENRVQGQHFLVKLVVQLIELGNDVNAVADFGDYVMTGDPEHTLLYYPHNIGELLDLGVGDPRWDESTPLHGAIIANQPSIVRYLIDQGARLNARTATGWTQPIRLTPGLRLQPCVRGFW